MKFQIGDKVVVSYSEEEGEIVDIINEQMVMVQVRGVRFPAYTDQLDFPYFKRFSAKKPPAPEKKEKKYIDQVPKEKPAAVSMATDLPEGVWLLFLPVFSPDEFGDEVVKLLKAHLINGTDTAYNFKYRLMYRDNSHFELQGQLFPKQNFYLNDVLFENINDSPVFELEFSLINPDRQKAEYYETTLKLKPRQVFNKIEELRTKGLPSFSYRLMERYPERVKEEKGLDLGKLTASGFKVYQASEIKRHLPPARTVVDIHIEKITDRYQNLDNYEIITLQLHEFEKYYELAVAHRQSLLIVIHGVGTGKLRDEIHDLLRRRKEVKSFVNQYHPSYGYGATEIYFQY